MRYIVTCLILFAMLIMAQEKPMGKVGFDPQKDPQKDLNTAIVEAQKSGKNIIIDVGGEWCIWCHRLHEFIESTETIKKLIADNYVFFYVNYSKENKNEKFLSQFPKVDGYPHLFVLDAKGKLLHSQNTGLLEKDKGYDGDKIIEFLKKWAPAKKK
ncbi:MAG: thioredoxin family protein [Ignavibacteria bacterium]|nr:thioredoxin family protein [Ignavibacteria bacterium]